MKNNLHIFILLREIIMLLIYLFVIPNIYLDFDWSVCDDLHGSDHFPILIKETESSNDEQHCRWNLKKANWETFTTLCQERLTPEELKQLKICLLSLQHYTTFRKSVFRKPRQGRKDVIHGNNDECKAAINKRKSALRKFNKNPSRGKSYAFQTSTC